MWVTILASLDLDQDTPGRRGRQPRQAAYIAYMCVTVKDNTQGKRLAESVFGGFNFPMPVNNQQMLHSQFVLSLGSWLLSLCSQSDQLCLPMFAPPCWS